MTGSIEDAVWAASEKWQAAFNAGDAAECASCYEEDATIVATPFGTFNGRDAIEGFWRAVINQGFTDVQYLDPKMTVVDPTSAVLTSGWRMNRASGVITKELWVLQDDGTAKLREDHFEVRG